MRPHRQMGALFMIMLLLLVGCSQDLSSLDFDVNVDVAGTAATVSVTVTGIKDVNYVHSHLFLDGGPELMIYADTYTYYDLEPGEHELVVELATPDHKAIPGQQKSVTFVIEEPAS